MSDDDAPPAVLWEFPTWLLLQLSQPAIGVVAQAIDGPDRRSDFAVLAALAEFGPASQTELCRRLHVDRSDMVALLNHLQADGHATRAPDPLDRRRNSVSLTSAGRSHLRRLQKNIEAAQSEFLEPLPPSEQQALVKSLQTLVAHHCRGTQR